MRLFALSEIFRVSHARLHVLAGVAGLQVQDEYDEEATGRIVMLLHLDEWLGRSVSPDPDQRLVLLGLIWPDLREHLLVLDKFLQSGHEQLPHFRLGIADARYGTWPTARQQRAMFYDVQTGQWVEQLPIPPLELWSLDINALRVRTQRALYEHQQNLASQGK